MAIDGLFLHFLVKELNGKLTNGRINKIVQISPFDVILQVHNNKPYNLMLSSSRSNPRILITRQDFKAPNNPYNFCMVLRKYIERGIILVFEQVENDRIVVINIKSTNELGIDATYKLILELTGKYANIILTDEEYTIIDSVTKHINLTDDSKRLIMPKAHYNFIESTQINPFNITDLNYSVTELQGISKFHQQFINDNLQDFLNHEVIPSKYIIDNKVFLSPFKFSKYKSITYPTLSTMLDEESIESTKESNPNYSYLKKIINRKLNLLNHKIDNLNSDIDSAKTHTSDLLKGRLLQTYLYEVKKGMKEIVLKDFETNENVLIELDPLKTPTENMQKYFKSYKKSLNTLKYANEQIKITNDQISYFLELSTQIEIGLQSDIEEIKNELINQGFIKSNKKSKMKTNILQSIKKYTVNSAIIYVGKNNIQNTYIISNLGKPNDYWFHVKDYPSAHILIKSSNLDERLIRIGAQLASINSKFSKSNSVMVDYTKFKNIKKIPNSLGCKVTYTNQSSIYIDPDMDTLTKLLTNNGDE